MSEFNRVASATYSPTRCALCITHEGPFIDTHIEWPAYGHVYICGGCVKQMANQFEMVDGSLLAETLVELDLATQKIEQLESAQIVYISLDDAMKLAENTTGLSDKKKVKA